MRQFLTKLSLLSTGLILPLLLAEAFLRIFFPQPVDYFYYEKQSRPNSTTTRWGMQVRINSAGYRDQDHAIQKPMGVRRIAVIGDSITYGAGVEFEDTYHQQLGKLLRNTHDAQIEILAFNQGATSTDWARNTYAKVARLYHPDYVILGFCLNDFQDYEQSEEPQTTSALRSVYDVLAEVHMRARVWSHLYFLLFERSRRFFYQYLIDRTIRTQDSWIPMSPLAPNHEALFRKQLTSTANQIEKLSKLVTEDGAKFLVVIFPFEMQLTQNLNTLYSEEYRIKDLSSALRGEAQKLLSSELAARGIESVDLLLAFRNYADAHRDTQLYFRELGGMLDWAHPNKTGHALAASEILPRMRN